MAKSKSHRRAKPTIPLAVIAGMVPTVVFAVEGYKVGGFENAFRRTAQRLTGYDSTANVFIWKELMAGWGPLLTGYFVHKAASRFGINRAIAKAGIPLFRI